MSPDTAVPWGTIVAIGAPVLAAFGTILVFFVKRLLRATEKIYELKFDQLSKDVVQLNERNGLLVAAHDRLRDRWDEFLREYLKIDSTRGQKIDALFRVVDQMQDAVRELKPALNSKVEDSFCRALSELKVYVRDQIREEKKNV
jgi:hypothetical protein